jgi:hypothetical protein
MRITKRLAISLLLLLFTLPRPIQAAVQPAPRIDEVVLTHLVGYLESAKDEAIWPGYDLAAYTLVYGIGDTYYLLNAPSTSSSKRLEGQPLPSPPGVSRLENETVRRLGLATDNVWDEKDVEGERVFIVKQLPQANTADTLDPIHEFLTLFHETFHFTAQESFMHRMASGDERILDEEDFAYTQLEASLLARLIGETNPNSLKTGALLYLAVRQKHESVIPKKYADYRQGMTVTEGTAQYLTDKFFERSHPKATSNHIAYTTSRLKEALEKPQEADRSRYYVMGAAVCHLLDRLMPDWKGRFSDYVDSLDGLLAEAVSYQHLPEETIQQLGHHDNIDQELSRYKAQFQAKAAAESREIEQVMTAFRSQGATRLSLRLPSHLVSMGGSWVESWDLADGRRLTRGKLLEFTHAATKQPVLSMENVIAIRQTMPKVLKIELYRTLEPSEIRMNGEPLLAGSSVASGSLEIDQPGFKLRVRQAILRREGDGLHVDVTSP